MFPTATNQAILSFSHTHHPLHGTSTFLFIHSSIFEFHCFCCVCYHIGGDSNVPLIVATTTGWSVCGVVIIVFSIFVFWMRRQQSGMTRSHALFMFLPSSN